MAPLRKLSGARPRRRDAFLRLVRAVHSSSRPYAWLGYSWMGCTEQHCGPPNDPATGGWKPPCDASGVAHVAWQFPPELERDHGVPLALRTA